MVQVEGALIRCALLGLAVLAAACGGQTSDDKPDTATPSDSAANASGDAAADVVVFNGCTASDYLDLSAATATRTVTVGATYSPRCITVKVGQQVVFKGDLKNHAMATDEADGPFAGYATVGDEAFVNFPRDGYFPYFDENNKASTGVVRAVR